MWASIWASISGFFSSLSLFDKWFSKTPIEKTEDIDEVGEENREHKARTGRYKE